MISNKSVIKFIIRYIITVYLLNVKNTNTFVYIFSHIVEPSNLEFRPVFFLTHITSNV